MKINHIFLSPHNDDVCFSLGALAYSHQQGQLVNIYTLSQYVSETFLNKSVSQSIKKVTAMRNEEDAKFARFCNLTRHDLRMSDSSVYGLDPYNLENLDNQAAVLAEVLIPCLVELYQLDQDNILYCPMGVGGHRDHLATLMAILNNKIFLQKKMRLLFYFDLPYSSIEHQQKVGLQRFMNISKSTKIFGYSKLLTSFESEVKLKMINFYMSQHVSVPNINDFVINNNHDDAEMREVLIEINSDSLR